MMLYTRIKYILETSDALHRQFLVPRLALFTDTYTVSQVQYASKKVAILLKLNAV